MRDSSTGLNVDFMSYAAYSRAAQDPIVLLDSNTLLRETEEVFSTFFQHYVSSNVSLETGGWGYQPIGSDLKVAPPVPSSASHPGSKFEDSPMRNTTRTVNATLYREVEVLQVNLIAFGISISIML